MSYNKVSIESDITCTETDRVSVQAADFVGKGVYTGSVLELEKILDNLFSNPTPALKAVVESLSPEKFKRLARLHKSLQNAKGGAFKWASMEEIEKEALFGFGAKKDSLTLLDKVLKRYQEQTGESILDLPGMVKKKFDSLGLEIEKNIAKRPVEPSKSEKEPGLFEKGQDVGRALKEKGQEVGRAVGEKAVGVGKAVGEKAKEVGKAVGEKAKDVAQAPGRFMEDIGKRYQKYQEERAEKQRQIQESQADAEGKLKNYLANKTPFTKIFYSLPPEIIKELNEIGFNPEGMAQISHPSSAPSSKPQKIPVKSVGPKRVKKRVTETTKLASDVVLRYLKSQNDAAVGETVESSSVEQSL